MDGDAPRQLNGGPDGRMFVLPTVELTISPTWREAAVMQGTGSNEASAKDVFVPEVFAYSFAQPPLIDRPHFRTPMPLVVLPLNTAVVVGLLGAALESAVEAISSKVGSISGQTLRDQQPIQELVADCRAIAFQVVEKPRSCIR
jgi:alkylation response protein AidB-like acyl-CoA dehydrogenase